MKPLHVTLPIRIRGYDIDFVGHVNNIVYIRWLEDLRMHLLDVYYPLEMVTSIGVAPVIVTTNVHYRQPIRLDDREVAGEMWIERLEAATFHLAAEFRVGEGLRCTATQRGTFINMEKNRPVRVPARLREQFEEHRDSVK